MGKVVINQRFGGFELSAEGQQWLLDNTGSAGYSSRHDPKLIECVEALGSRASTAHSRLVVKDFLGNVYRITDYDGYEGIETPDSIKWTTID